MDEDSNLKFEMSISFLAAMGILAFSEAFKGYVESFYSFLGLEVFYGWLAFFIITLILSIYTEQLFFAMAAGYGCYQAFKNTLIEITTMFNLDVNEVFLVTGVIILLYVSIKGFKHDN